MITGEPILVLSDSPMICSNAVLAIVSLISPVEYTGDIRPYFTIFDPDFRDIQTHTENRTLGPMIIGVTNPFFLKAL